MLGQLTQLLFASGALLAARSAQLCIRILVLLLIAVWGAETELAGASYALSLAEIGRALADFGTDTWSVRALTMAHDRRRETRIVAAVALIKAAGWLIVGAGILLICSIKLPSGNTFGLLAAALLLASQAIGLVVSYFQAKAQVGRLKSMWLPCIATAGAACASLLLTGSGLLALAITAAGELCMAALLSVMLYRSLERSDLAHVGLESLVTARQCVPAAAFNAVAALSARLDTIVLAQISLQALAAYTVIQRLFQPFLVLATSFSAIIYRHTAHALATRHSFTRGFLTRDLPSILGIATILALALFACGRIFLEHAVPRDRAMLGSLTVLCFTLPLYAYNATLSGMLQGFGRFWTLLIISTLDLTLMLAVMSYWAPRHAITGIIAGLLAGAGFNAVGQTLATVTAARGWARSVTTPISAH
jgi:O-antigen/teichoic acid export membrane protein